MRNIVVLGNGFSAVNLALKLTKYFQDSVFYKIYLVSDRNYLIYHPLLSRLVFDLEKGDHFKKTIALSVPEILKGKKMKFIQKPITRIDFQNQRLAFEDKSKLEFHKLIFALESVIDEGKIPGVYEYGHFSKDLNQAINTRKALQKTLKDFEKETFRLLIIGAGISGVETAGLAFKNLQKYFKDKTEQNFEICLIDKNPFILHDLPKNIAEKIQKSLKRIGIKAMTDKKVRRVYKYCVEFSDSKILEYDFLIWTGGIMANPLLKNFKLPKNKKNFLQTNENFQIKDQSFDSAFPSTTHYAKATRVKKVTGDRQDKDKCLYAIGDSRAADFQRTIFSNLQEVDWLAENIYQEMIKEKAANLRENNIVFIDLGRTTIGLKNKKIVSKNFQAFWQKNFLEFQQLRSFFTFDKALKIWLQILKIYLQK